MTHICRNCKRAFATVLELELHRDTCSRSQLFCRRCGERFAERTATTDGWHYRCPGEDCDGQGLGDDLRQVEDVRLTTR